MFDAPEDVGDVGHGYAAIPTELKTLPDLNLERVVFV